MNELWFMSDWLSVIVNYNTQQIFISVRAEWEAWKEERSINVPKQNYSNFCCKTSAIFTKLNIDNNRGHHREYGLQKVKVC